MLYHFYHLQAVSSFIHTTMKNTSTGISYLNGPIEKMELGRNPIKSFYFFVVGVPHVSWNSNFHPLINLCGL